MAAHPANGKLNNLIGIALQQQLRFDEAAVHMARACELEPTNPEFHSNLAATLILNRRFPEAETAARRAIALSNERADAHANLGTALRRQGRQEEAVASFRAAALLRPDFPSYRTNVGDILQQLGRINEAIVELRAVVASAPDNLKARSDLIMTLNYSDAIDGAELLREARALGELATRKASGRRIDARPNRTAGAPLRIGFVSGDLRHHAVAQFLEGVLPILRSAGHALYAYATRDAADEMTERLRGWFAGWHDISRTSDRAAAELVAGHGIHVLVDLSGHSGANRLPLFAYRPAPVTASWIGYSGTTGLAEMDYLISDRHVVPEGDAALHIETPIWLPDSYLLFHRPASAPETSELPVLASGHRTFGSFNNLSKLSEVTIATWSRVLNAVAGSRLVLKSPTLASEEGLRLVAPRFAAHGVGADRLTVLGRIADTSAHLAAYAQVDICLDPFPYAGTTTTCEALWMGRPVVTLDGARFAARVGASLLRTAGLADWVAQSEADYVEVARQKAADIEGLVQLSRGLRAQVLASPLMDAERFGSQLNAVFETMWAERSGRG